MEPEIGVMWSQTKEADNHQKLQEAWNGFPPRTSEGAADTVILDCWPPEL